ncbi:unnamed protein product [Chondrus crispus]|uniref:Uncharacterized protein n=1 Tax=Chondrus crispus TaxID=2769 RepID=R7QMW9_CHOCR|nr:unnamed protein product [Chondrus crispus]CDF38730.1 unnamed protein product [Chondrus crispus]|eukprot:XP_005718635.1 unnamed protein product [Chondrus crispus]
MLKLRRGPRPSRQWQALLRPLLRLEQRPQPEFVIPSQRDLPPRREHLRRGLRFTFRYLHIDLLLKVPPSHQHHAVLNPAHAPRFPQVADRDRLPRLDASDVNVVLNSPQRHQRQLPLERVEVPPLRQPLLQWRLPALKP